MIIPEWFSNSWIFVVYVPGAYGSFLTKAIEQSPEVAALGIGPMVNDQGAYHNGVTEWIRGFHHGDEIDAWSCLDSRSRAEYIEQHIDRELWQQYTYWPKVHRFTVPRYLKMLQSHFPRARLVHISIDIDVDIIARNMANKTLLHGMPRFDPQVLEVIQQLDIDSDQVREHYYLKQCRARIEQIKSVGDQVHGCFDFPCSCFLDHDKFLQRMRELYVWLELPPADVKHLHQEFLERNAQ